MVWTLEVKFQLINVPKSGIPGIVNLPAIYFQVGNSGSMVFLLACVLQTIYTPR